MNEYDIITRSDDEGVAILNEYDIITRSDDERLADFNRRGITREGGLSPVEGLILLRSFQASLRREAELRKAMDDGTIPELLAMARQVASLVRAGLSGVYVASLTEQVMNHDDVINLQLKLVDSESVLSLPVRLRRFGKSPPDYVFNFHQVDRKIVADEIICQIRKAQDVYPINGLLGGNKLVVRRLPIPLRGTGAYGCYGTVDDITVRGIVGYEATSLRQVVTFDVLAGLF